MITAHTSTHALIHIRTRTHAHTHRRENTQTYLFAHETIFRVFNELISVKRHSEKCLMGRKKYYCDHTQRPLARSLSPFLSNVVNMFAYVCGGFLCERVCIPHVYVHKFVCVCWMCCWLQMYMCACVLNYIVRPNVAHTHYNVHSWPKIKKQKNQKFIYFALINFLNSVSIESIFSVNDDD